MTKSSILTINSGSWSITLALFQTDGLLNRTGLSELDPTFDDPVTNRRDSRTTVRVVRTDEGLMIARSVSYTLKTGATKGFDS